MRFAGLKNISKINLQLQLKKIFEVALSWRHLGSWRWRWTKNIFETGKWIFAETYGMFPFVSLQTPRFRWDIGFRYGLTLGVGTL